MEDNELYKRYETHNWHIKLSRLIYQGKKQQALRLLDRFIESVLPLFQNNSEILEERRIALLLRTELLKKWNRKIEALAWICLECELNPDHKKAQIYKEQLKQELNLKSVINEQSILDELYHPSSDWEGIAGMQEVKTVLEMDVINPLKNPLLYSRFRVSIPNGILLFGPPGCGKTFIAGKIASKIHYNFIAVTPSTIASTYVHGTQEKISALFEKAKSEAPTILFFDEFDAFAPNRGDSNTSYHYRAEVNEFLTQLNECHERNILVVAATNNPSLLDPAVLRPGRLDIKIFVPPPDIEARIEIFKMYMNKRPQIIIDYIRLGEYTELYSIVEIKNIVELCARKVASLRRKITTDDLIEQILQNPPSLSEELVEKMRKWNVN